MCLSVCMVVKNEINTLRASLDPIIDHIDELIVIDNNSTDGTYELLKEHYGIQPMRMELSDERCLNKAELRNMAFQQAKNDWILSLDADEIVDLQSLKIFEENSKNRDIAGFFGFWINHLQGITPFEDYKLFIFQKELQKRGLIHENVQIDIRQKGLNAIWLDGFTVQHHPEATKHISKEKLYKERLICAIKKEPEWIRYHWFLGYMYFQESRYDEAIECFSYALNTPSTLFPVEQLNSAMVLIEIYIKRQEIEKASAVIEKALRLFYMYEHDFEVKINKKILPWLNDAKSKITQKFYNQISAYRFAK